MLVLSNGGVENVGIEKRRERYLFRGQMI